MDLGLSENIVYRHPFPGPGLAIRILCGDEPYIDKDFSETQVVVKIVVEYNDMVLKVKNCNSYPNKNMQIPFNNNHKIKIKF